jgi:phosphatidyl-myo-inositol alpha-mannosyltransferase
MKLCTATWRLGRKHDGLAMRIGFVLDDTLDRPDGVQQYVLTLGRWLGSQGHEVHYLVANTRRRDVPNVHSLGRFVSLNFNGNRVRTPLPASRRRIRALVAELKLDVLHVQLPYSPLLGERVVLAAEPKTAVVGTFHTLPVTAWEAATNRLLARRLRRSAGRFGGVVAVSKPAAEFAQAAYGWAAAVVPCPIDATMLSAAGERARETRQAMGGDGRGQHGRVRVVFLGRLVRRKGVLQLIRAFHALPAASARRARLVIGGGGSLAKRASKLAASNPAIRLSGFVPERAKAKFLASADIAVFPATSGESFGIILAEAMAAGASVVLGGDNPGYTSALGEHSAALFDPNDTAAFSRKLAYFIDDEAARRKLHESQQRLVKKYDVQLVGRQIEKLYQRALRAARRGHSSYTY